MGREDGKRGEVAVGEVSSERESEKPSTFPLRSALQATSNFSRRASFSMVSLRWACTSSSWTSAARSPSSCFAFSCMGSWGIHGGAGRQEPTGREVKSSLSTASPPSHDGWITTGWKIR